MTSYFRSSGAKINLFCTPSNAQDDIRINVLITNENVIHIIL